MAYCSRCGRPIADGEICVCSRPKKTLNVNDVRQFTAKFKNKMGIGTPESNSMGVYERGRKIVPECIATNENEIPIKQYDLAILRTRAVFQRAEGRLQVTNQRLIFRATGRSLVGPLSQQYEFSISDLAGVEIRTDYHFSLLNWFLATLLLAVVAFFGMNFLTAFNSLAMRRILSLVLGIGGFVPFFLVHKEFPGKLIFSTIGLCNLVFAFIVFGMAKWMIPLMLIGLVIYIINWVLVVFVKNLVLSVKTSAGNGAVQIRRSRINLFNQNAENEFTGFAEVIPWTDAEVASREIGALIDDIQIMGDGAIEKWRVD